MRSALEYLLATAAQKPDKIAVRDDQNALTFSQLCHRASLVANALGDCTNRPIIVFLPKSTNAIVAFAAILGTGGFYVPMDVDAPAERQRKIAENLDPAFVVTISEMRNVAKVLEPYPVLCIDDIPFNDQSKPLCVPPSVIDCDPIYVIFTSGSTGTPKGVVVPHRGVLDYINWAIEVLKPVPDDVIGNQAPLYFDNSALDVYLSWALGCELVLIEQSVFMFPQQLVDCLSKASISWIFCVPSILSNVARFDIDVGKVHTLKTIVFAGEAIKSKSLRHWQNQLPNARFFNLYGPTEITVDCTWFEITRQYTDAENIPIGHPCANTDVFLLNSEDAACRDGEIGELCVRGSSLALGYYDNAEQSDAAFVQNPLNTLYRDPIYRTGDLARKKDGLFYFVGRKDCQVKVNGIRVELGEIETVACNLPEVANGICLFDSDTAQIMFVYEAETELNPGKLRDSILQVLPKYMAPKHFVHFTNLPMTSNGKVDRTSLKKQLLITHRGWK